MRRLAAQVPSFGFCKMSMKERDTSGQLQVPSCPIFRLSANTGCTSSGLIGTTDRLSSTLFRLYIVNHGVHPTEFRNTARLARLQMGRGEHQMLSLNWKRKDFRIEQIHNNQWRSLIAMANTFHRPTNNTTYICGR